MELGIRGEESKQAGSLFSRESHYPLDVYIPAWRGRGLYPRLLQAILQQEQRVDRFWIGYEPGNEASAHGIKKAGFQVIGDLVIAEGRVSGLALFGSRERAQASAEVFQLPIVAQT